MNDKKDPRFGKKESDDDKKGSRPSAAPVGTSRPVKKDEDEKKGSPFGTSARKEEEEKKSSPFGVNVRKEEVEKKGSPFGGSKESADDKKASSVAGAKASISSSKAAEERQDRKSKLAGVAATAFVAGASMTPEQEGELRSRIDSLRSRYNSLHDRVNLNSIVSDINEMTAKIDQLPAQIREIRSAGYAFASYLEQKADVLKQHWDSVRDDLNQTTQRESYPLRDDLRDYDQHLLQADQALKNRRERASDQFLSELENGLNNIDNQVGAIERRLRSSYETLEEDTYQTESQIKKIKWYLEKLNEACFQLQAGESVFMAADAEWLDNRDNPDGFLFLTDQRMIFEQRETTGKFLGMFGGQKQQDVKWEFPISAVEKVEPENKGMFGGKDMLNFSLGSGAPYAKITVEVKGDADCKVWAQQINRMKNGDARNERATEPSQELVETLKNAPSNCHVCGASLPVVMQGQLQIECAYCGTVIRLVK